ncbi:MAG TPA: homoserine dehydrogenase [Campylobacterales bacterium]|nr:homoserine dehydrogenase [Campylobacterales bacterium]HIP59133.1 homoserine dehydrogenase [Campylobacterales bacterium]
MVNVAIIGVGTVGKSVADILEKNKKLISARAGKEINVVKGVVRDRRKKRDVSIPLTIDINEVLEDDSIDIVVELMGGVDEPFKVIKKALTKGKAVVTANKALLAYHRYDLQEIAGDIPIGYEASVAGGIPIINALKVGLSANQILSIKGIMNGTCNYMLTKMRDEGVSFDVILKEAQELGYAEADPTFDVGGFDAAHKLLILASIAYGIDAKPEDILIEGIEDINEYDMDFAKEFGYSIKLLAIAKKSDHSVELRVHPALVKNSQMIAKIDGVMNGISVIGDFVGETLYYGPGAGGDATASAVVADIVEIVRAGQSSPMLGFKKPHESQILKLLPAEEMESEYYIRMKVGDKSGVLADITKILANHDISIETILQRPAEDNDKAMLLCATHTCKEKQIKQAISEIEALDALEDKISMIRIED